MYDDLTCPKTGIFLERKMKNLIKPIAVLVFVCALFLMARPALATCDEQYGGVCRELELLVNKKVWDPVNEYFVDNLGIHDYKFGPEEEITFILKIKNTGDEKFDEVHVKDYLPDYLKHLSGDLDFIIYDLDPDEEVEKEIKVKVVPANEFPDEAIICVVNSAEAWSDDEKDKDTAQVCLEKKVLGVTVLPPTGPENWLIILPFSLLVGVAGFYLKKFSK